MSRNIIDRLNQDAAAIVEPDVDDWIVSDLLAFYSTKLKSLAEYAYNLQSGDAHIAQQAFQELASKELSKAVYTYMFTSQHWRTGRDISSYLATCLSRLADRVKRDVAGTKRIVVPMCPGCRFIGNREYLSYEGKLFRCTACTNEINKLEDKIATGSKDKRLSDAIEAELRLRQIFSVHTRKGWRCPDCERFIPDSFLVQYGVACPYPDCWFFGVKTQLEPMTHPLGLGAHEVVSLSTPRESYHGGTYQLQDMFQDENTINPDDKISFTEQSQNEFSVLTEVIALQTKRVKTNSKSILKLLMYQAYENMLASHTEEMISYLVHRRHVSGLPIQSTIFQEFIRLVENSLPITISRKGSDIEICSLLDPELGIFWGTSEFDAQVKPDHTIPNNTIETYTGGRQLKKFGPCFIGLLVDIKDSAGKSLINQVEKYSFVQISMHESVPVGERVHVIHFRIPSHYEMGSLTYLQRIRRKIVDSVYLKLHGKKRKTKNER